MKKLLLAAVLAASATTIVPAGAQGFPAGQGMTTAQFGGGNRLDRMERREMRREMMERRVEQRVERRIERRMAERRMERRMEHRW